MSEFLVIPGSPYGAFELRGQDVILDADLADLYGVSTVKLNNAVRRNKERFPQQFMFRLTPEELEYVRWTRGWLTQVKRRRTPPYAFTIPGALMASSVLDSRTAAELNRHIMQGFVGFQVLLWEHEALQAAVQELEGRAHKNNRRIRAAFEAYREILKTGPGLTTHPTLLPPPPKRRKKEAPPSDAKPTTKKPSRPKKTRAR